MKPAALAFEQINHLQREAAKRLEVSAVLNLPSGELYSEGVSLFIHGPRAVVQG